MESFLSRYRNPLVLLAVVLAQMIGLAVQVRRPANGVDGQQTRLARYWVTVLASPFERVFLFVGHGVSNTWHSYIDLRHVRAQNLQLQTELNRVRLEQAALAEEARQDLRLQKLLAFQQHYVSKTVAAHVIGTSGTDLSRVLYIDKGSSSGIKPDMPVITPDGVVGKVRDVFPHTAQVLEINDQTSGLGVVLSQTRLRGILRGNTIGQTEIVDILPDERIQPGEPVVTSGGDDVYPSGLPVGNVERIVNDPERNPYVAILIKPSVNLSRLDEVLVITQTSDAMPSAMQQDVTTSEQKAADVLSQRLPGALPPPTVGADGKPIDANAPPPPVKPPAPLHPDRFTPGAAPPANDLVPGAAYAKQMFPPEARPASAPATTTAKPATPPVSKPAANLDSSVKPKPPAASAAPEH
jgi:rod shape-determining protein MreC